MNDNARQPDETFENYRKRLKLQKSMENNPLTPEGFRRNEVHDMSREEYRAACAAIPRDHDIVIRGICECGNMDPRQMIHLYHFTDESEKLEFIENLKNLIVEVQNGEVEVE